MLHKKPLKTEDFRLISNSLDFKRNTVFINKGFNIQAVSNAIAALPNLETSITSLSNIYNDFSNFSAGITFHNESNEETLRKLYKDVEVSLEEQKEILKNIYKQLLCT